MGYFKNVEEQGQQKNVYDLIFNVNKTPIVRVHWAADCVFVSWGCIVNLITGKLAS